MIATWPEIVKANRQEVERLLRRPLENDAELLTAAREMRVAGRPRRR